MSWPSIELAVYKDRFDVLRLRVIMAQVIAVVFEIADDLSMAVKRAQKRRPPQGRG